MEHINYIYKKKNFGFVGNNKKIVYISLEIWKKKKNNHSA